ncbi:hypothetical protein APHAL10511_001706 [Amanita phalloides]|nr:hypothetical protein APHAL10511_001706 [Amanita phalloides]
MIKITDRLPTEGEYLRVRHLVLQQVGHITDNELASVIGACTHLESAVLSGIPDLSDRTLILLAKTATDLQGINLNSCTHITDDGVLALTAQPLPLQWVRLNGAVNLTDQSVLAITTALSRLVELELCDLPLITPVSTSSVWTQLRKLRVLRLARCPLLTDVASPPASGRRPEAEESLEGLALRYDADSLRVLDLTRCKITDESVERIVAYAPKIQNLILTGCDQLTDRALDNICRLGDNLDVLSMSHVTEITDAAVVRLARSCPKLRGVDFGFCQKLTDMSVFEVASLSYLKRLSLMGLNNITDIAIYAIAEHAVELERFHLAHCNQISLEAVYMLLKNLRKLQQVVLNGVPSCQGDGMEQLSEEPPAHLDAEQQAVFRVYKGQNISRLREFLDLEKRRKADDEAE